MLLGLSKLKNKNEFIAITLFVVSAARFDVGFDFLSYYNSIELFQPHDMTYIRFGLLHGGLIEFSNYIGFTQLYFIVTSAVIYFFIHLSLNKHSENYLYSILIFIGVPFFFLMSFNFIKQFTAMVLVLYSIRYIFERKLLSFIFVIFIASLLHYTAIMCVCLYYLYGRKIPSVFLIVFFASSFFAFPLAQNIIDTLLPFYSHYLDVKVEGGKSFQALLILLFLLFIMFRRLINNKKSDFYFVTFIIGACIYNTFQPIGFSATRVSYYFLIFLILLVPSFGSRIRKKQFTLLLIALTFTLFIISLYSNSKVGTRSPSVPYQTFFNKTIHDIRPYGWVKK